MQSEKTVKQQVDEMIEKCREFDAQKVDHTVPADALWFTDMSKLLGVKETGLFANTGAGNYYAPTEHAYRQAFVRLAKTVWGSGTNKALPYDYLMAIDDKLFADVMNKHLTDSTDDFFVRTYADKARAILSPQYAKYDNIDALETFAGILSIESASLGDGQLVRPSVTPDALHLKAVWQDTGTPDGSGGTYGVGVCLVNGEIGNSRVKVLPMVQRTSCTNSLVLDTKNFGVSIVHRGNGDAQKVFINTEIHAAIANIFPQAQEAIERMVEAERQEIPRFADVLAGLAKDKGWNSDISHAVSVGTEGRATRAGIVNGITYAAHAAGQSAEQAHELETLGGSMLVARDSVFTRLERVGARERA